MREDFAARNVVDDKDEAAAADVIRPGVEPFGREHRVLRRLDERRLVVAVAERDNAFDAQQIAAMGAGKRAQRLGEIEPGDGIEDHREAVDAVGMGGDFP